MKITITGVDCTMGCLYAESPISLCLCRCGGKVHGQLAANRIEAVKCSPAAETRCKAGEEDGPCACACNGINHGLYRNKEIEGLKISHYTDRS